MSRHPNMQVATSWVDPVRLLLSPGVQSWQISTPLVDLGMDTQQEDQQGASLVLPEHPTCPSWVSSGHCSYFKLPRVWES